MINQDDVDESLELLLSEDDSFFDFLDFFFFRLLLLFLDFFRAVDESLSDEFDFDRFAFLFLCECCVSLEGDFFRNAGDGEDFRE